MYLVTAFYDVVARNTLLVVSSSASAVAAAAFIVLSSAATVVACFVNFQEARPPSCKPTEPEDWLESLVTLLGYWCLDNREHQGVLQRGPSPILGRLCNLPFR